MKRWYVVQVYAGYEETVKTDLEQSVFMKKDFKNIFGEVLIPSAHLKAVV